MQALSQDACVARSSGSVLTANSFIRSRLLREQNSEKRRGQRTDINVRGAAHPLESKVLAPRRGMLRLASACLGNRTAGVDPEVKTSGRRTQLKQKAGETSSPSPPCTVPT